MTRKLTHENLELFFCDMKDFVQDTYFPTYFVGIRKYIRKYIDYLKYYVLFEYIILLEHLCTYIRNQLPRMM